MARSRSREVEIGWTYEGEGYVVTCEVTGRHVPATRVDPEEWPDVDVLSVASEDGQSRPDLLQIASDDPGLIDDVLVEVAEEERGAWEDEQDRRCDMDRDDRMMGEGRYARKSPGD